MPKTKVKITTKSNNITDTYEIKALLKDNKLMYYEPNKTKVIFDYENNKGETAKLKIQPYGIIYGEKT